MTISRPFASSMSITNNLTSNSALPISSDQSLRDLYSNTRGSVSSPRKIYFRRVTHQTRHPIVLSLVCSPSSSVTIQLCWTGTSPSYSHLFHQSDEDRRATWSTTLREKILHRRWISRRGETMDTRRVLRQWKSATQVTTDVERPKMIRRRTRLVELNVDWRMFSSRLTEVTLSSQTNPLPFRLHIWPNRSCTDELENSSNRYYHVEEILLDETDLGKEIELIPVAHYTKVRISPSERQLDFCSPQENTIQINLQKCFPFLLKVIHVRSLVDRLVHASFSLERILRRCETTFTNENGSGESGIRKGLRTHRWCRMVTLRF